jgi:glycosyltransferase involved in cell wall biosynthesis
MRVAILTVQLPFVRGGAELLAEGLLAALRQGGHEAEIVTIPFLGHPPERIPEQILACRLLDVSHSCGVPIDRVIGLKFPAYLIPHPNKVLWILHQHRQAYDLWSHEFAGMSNHPAGQEIRDAIRQADMRLIPEARHIFTIARNVSKRLMEHCQIASTALYHPPQGAEQFYCADDHGYLYYPSRLSPLKRQSLVIRALAMTRQPVCIHFAGTPDVPTYGEELKALAADLGVADRVAWLGYVTTEEKIRQYAHARGVVFTPLDEDYGYITLEAMLAGKPVVTCTDSGGPLEFVSHREAGLVAEPTLDSLAEALDEVWADPGRARRLGAAGRERYNSLGISWDNVVEKLLS